MPKLICKGVKFYSQNDELAFFEWLSRIKAIAKYQGIADELHLHVPRTSISDTSLREILALCYRYKIDMKQLHIFLNEKNSAWFSDKRAYWYKRVFTDSGSR